MLRLGGALRPPDPTPPAPPDVYEQWDQPYPRPLQEALAGLVNLPDDYQRAGAVDPIVAPPLYGRWHALVQRVLRDPGGTLILPEETWVSRLNLDPRFRVAGGLGTRVVQDRQEAYMQAAWEQVGAVLEAQRRIRLGQLGVRVSQVWHERYLAPTVGLGVQRALSLVAPVTRRLVAGGVTVRHAMAQAYVQPTMTTAALRRIARPGARLVRGLPFDVARPIGALLDRVNRREVSAAPPKVAPPGVLTDDEAAALARPAGPPISPLWTLIGALVLAVLLFVVAVVVGGALGVAAAVLGLLVAVAGLVGYRILARRRLAVVAADSIRGDHQTVAAVDALPGAAGFVIADLGQSVPVHAGADSPEAARLKSALRDAFGVHRGGRRRRPDSGPGVARSRHGRRGRGGGARAGRDRAAPRPGRGEPAGRASSRRSARASSNRWRTRSSMCRCTSRWRRSVPSCSCPTSTSSRQQRHAAADQPALHRGLPGGAQPRVRARAAVARVPDRPARHARSASSGTCAAPTTRTGRRRRALPGAAPTGSAPEAFKEKLRDIPPIHKWPGDSALGTHDNREATTTNEDELVLVIRGRAAQALSHRGDLRASRMLAAQERLGGGARTRSVLAQRRDRQHQAAAASSPLTPDQEANPPRASC